MCMTHLIPRDAVYRGHYQPNESLADAGLGRLLSAAALFPLTAVFRA